jgi:hypothetical protein
MRTLQETFDYVVDKIVGQGGRCMSGEVVSSGCAYGDGEGKHCSIGWLLDPNDRDLMKYSGGVACLARDFPFALPDVVVKNIEIFSSVQIFHDTAMSRNRKLDALDIQKQGINISNPNVQKWIDMGI